MNGLKKTAHVLAESGGNLALPSRGGKKPSPWATWKAVFETMEHPTARRVGACLEVMKMLFETMEHLDERIVQELDRMSEPGVRRLGFLLENFPDQHTSSPVFTRLEDMMEEKRRSMPDLDQATYVAYMDRPRPSALKKEKTPSQEKWKVVASEDVWAKYVR